MTTLNCPVCGSGEFGDCVCPPRNCKPDNPDHAAPVAVARR